MVCLDVEELISGLMGPGKSEICPGGLQPKAQAVICLCQHSKLEDLSVGSDSGKTSSGACKQFFLIQDGQNRKGAV